MILLADGIELTNEEIAFLSNDLLDIEAWILAAIKGKINSCKGRMFLEWQEKFRGNSEIPNVPTDDDALVRFIVQQPDYLTRNQREKLLTAALKDGA